MRGYMQHIFIVPAHMAVDMPPSGSHGFPGGATHRPTTARSYDTSTRPHATQGNVTQQRIALRRTVPRYLHACVRHVRACVRGTGACSQS